MNEKILETFREEVAELLADLEGSLLELEETPDDQPTIDRVFRALHTIKGSSAMAGVDSIASFVHQVENVYELVREGELAVTRELIDLTLVAKDQLRLLVAALNGAGSVDSELLDETTAAFSQLLPASAVATPPSASAVEHAETCTYRIRFRPDLDAFRKGLNPMFVLRELRQMGECLIVPQLDAVPDLETLDPESCCLRWDVVLTTDQNIDDIRDLFIFFEDHCTQLAIDVIDDGGLLDTEAGYKKLGEILIERGDLDQEALNQALQSKTKIGESLIGSGLVSSGRIEAALTEQRRIQELRQERRVAEIASSIRVRSDKLDTLVNLIGELVTVQARLSQNAAGSSDAQMVSIAEEVERLTWDLRDQVLNIRMLPIGTTFNSYRRLVRDLCGELGKQVTLVTEGAETELDKTVIDRLGDPLVHLIRNCVDHGIESPEDRIAAGKPAQGTVRLSADHSGANVLLRISDDGRGLDRDALRRRAVANGLLAADAEIADRELYNLIFLPGFSTAREVTSVSGRGVGMDVVKRSVDELRGNIEVSSLPGQGTQFTIRLPLTLAIIDGLLVDIAGESYVFPLAAVEECVELRRAETAANDRNLANVRGELVPYVRLRDFFTVPGQRRDIEQIVIASIGGNRVGFVVDHVIGEHQTVIKSLGRFYQGIKGLSGATILGNGSVALILDLPQIVDGTSLLEKAAGF
jgi:two-component system chemotaxis sensor kinase CheA